MCVIRSINFKCMIFSRNVHQVIGVVVDIESELNSKVCGMEQLRDYCILFANTIFNCRLVVDYLVVSLIYNKFKII